MGSLTFVSLESIEDGSLIHETRHHSISSDLLGCVNRLELYCSAPSKDTLCLNVIGTGLCLVSVCDGRAGSVPLYLLNFRNELDLNLELNLNKKTKQVVSTFNGETRTIDVEQEENIQAKLTILEGQFISTFSINGKTLLGQTCAVAADDNRTGVSGLADLSSLLNDPDSFSNGNNVNEYIKNADNNDDDVNENSSDEDSDGADFNESNKNDDSGDDVNEYSSDEDTDGADVNEFTKNANTGDDVSGYSWDEDSDGVDVNEFTKTADTGDDINEYSWDEDSDGADVNESTKNDDDGYDVYGVGYDEKENDDDKSDCNDEELEVSASSRNKFGIPVFKTEVSIYNTYDKTVSKDRRAFRCTQCRSTSSSLGTYKDRPKKKGRIETDKVDIRTHRTKLLNIMQANVLSDYFFEAELISEENMIDVNEFWNRKENRAANSCLLNILRNRQISKEEIENVLIKAEEEHLLALMFPQPSKLVSVGTQTKASFDNKVMTEVFNESDTSRPVLFSYHF